MNEKKTWSPFVVLLAILFLAVFIVVPPLFRSLYPKEEENAVPEVKKQLLSCERIAFDEGYKVSNKILYEDAQAIKNTISYLVYTPTAEELSTKDDYALADMTVAEELAFFKETDVVEVNESGAQTVIILTPEIINNSDSKDLLTNYLFPLNAERAHLEAQGFTCTLLNM